MTPPYEQMVVEHEHCHASRHSDPLEGMQCRTFIPGLEWALDPYFEPS